MSQEPRIQFEKNGTIVGEIYHDANGNLVLTTDSGDGVRIDSLIDGTGTAYSAVDNRKRSFLAHVETNNGASIGSHTWETMPYNKIEMNKIDGATFDTSSYTLTLPAGTYYFDCFHNAYSTNDCNMRLYNPTTSTEIKQGSMAYGNNSAPMTLKGEISFSEETDIIVQIKADSSTSWGAGVVRNDNLSLSQTPYAGNFYVEYAGE